MRLPSTGVTLGAICILLLIGLIGAASASAGQDESVGAPPHLSVLEGRATVYRDGQLEQARQGWILASGDRLRVAAGRAEVLFGDGSVLHLDDGTVVDFLDGGLLRLLAGRVFLHVAAREGTPFEYRLDTPAASIATSSAGEYRVTVIDTTSAELAVSNGVASIATSEGTATLLAGQRTRARAGDRPGPVERFNAAAWDDFERWSHDRRRGGTDASVGLPVSTPTSAALPPVLAPYAATLASYGTWLYDSTHGHVWAPRTSYGWRPFYNGRWTSLAPYGWIWIGHDPWVWPTHYYGSWSVTPAGTWFWIPGRLFRPAAVHWIVTTAYIGWVPWGLTHAVQLALTLVPRHVFAVNLFVPRYSVRVHALYAHPWIAASGPPPLPLLPAARAFRVERRSIAARPHVRPRDRVPTADVSRASSQRIGANRAPDTRAPGHIAVPRADKRLNVLRAPDDATGRERARWPTGSSISRLRDMPAGFSLPPTGVLRAESARAPRPPGMAGALLRAPARAGSGSSTGTTPPRVVERWPGPATSGVITLGAPAPAGHSPDGWPQRYAVPRGAEARAD